jgi:glycosyltransferase involved in cell wall biosynthesis
VQLEAFYRQFPHLQDKRLILILGRIHEKKGCDLLVRAFGSLLERDNGVPQPWHLVLGGPVSSASHGRSLERLIKKTCADGSVTWTGLLTGDAKWGAFRAADVFALPSHQENFGVAVVEALACGLPVLISNKVNIWREVADDVAGLVGNDDQAGTDALLAKWIALDGATRRTMAVNARASFAKRFDVRNTAARLTATLEALR